MRGFGHVEGVGDEVEVGEYVVHQHTDYVFEVGVEGCHAVFEVVLVVVAVEFFTGEVAVVVVGGFAQEPVEGGGGVVYNGFTAEVDTAIDGVGVDVLLVCVDVGDELL